MQLPREILIGKGVLSQVSSICKKLGFNSPLLILSGSHMLDIVVKDVIDPLEQEGFEIKLNVVGDSDVDNVKTTTDIIEVLKPSVVLGIGGGKVIDIAKLSSSQKNISFISVPTSLSHDGISSSRASIKEVGRPVSVEAQSPIAIIGDLEIISKSPYQLTASGCGDIVAKYTAVKDWKLANKVNVEYYGDYAANLALMSAKLVMRNAKVIQEKKEEGFRIVLEALISCGVSMSIAGSSRPCSGSEHLFSHALDVIAPKPALHGEQCAIGSIMMAYLWKANWKKIKKKLEIIGVPTTSSELGIDSEHIIEALVSARNIRSNRYSILDVKCLNLKSARELALATGVI